MVAQHLLEGCAAEQRACDYLQSAGLILLAKNWRCAMGELDLIMRDREDIVFVEVRMRKKGHFGDAAESVQQAKQSKLIRAAKAWLQQHPALADHACRFDVIGITGDTLRWIKHAFY